MNSVLKGASYVLVHAPDMLVHGGTTQITERIVNPSSEYLEVLPNHLRSYADAAAYLPNQVYIGNKTPADMTQAGDTWFDKPLKKAERYGVFGEIMPQDEFYLLIQACDVFDLVLLEAGFVAQTRTKLKELTDLVRDGIELDVIKNAVKNEHAEGLYHNRELVGCVKKAHDIDANLSAGVIFENLISKASCTLSLLHLIRTTGVEKSSIDLVIDCSEEACGDMNQRGGGNMQKPLPKVPVL